MLFKYSCFLIIIFAMQINYLCARTGYPVVGTGQLKCYGDKNEISEPKPGQAYYGQDAQYKSLAAKYIDNGDGTITDLNTGLMWVKARGAKLTWNEAKAGASACSTGGYNDWRMPSIKELYSLIIFTGKSAADAAGSIPYLDTDYFDFVYGNTSAGERIIDCQDWSATEYVSTTMINDAAVFGVNFADGRIKGYPKMIRKQAQQEDNKLYVRFVRGNPSYGINRLYDIGGGLITDSATALMWAKDDSKSAMNWKDALAWVQLKNNEKYLGFDDWRMPTAKELQSIVDYTRSPETTNSPAISPVFNCTQITNEGGKPDYSFYWTNTTHLDNMGGAYISFGRGLGWMQFPPTFDWQLADVHGAGCQRSDPKSGNPADYPHGFGPQGDVIRINNYVRLVRSITIEGPTENDPPDKPSIPQGINNPEINIEYNYIFKGTDPDGDSLRYFVSWGDGSATGWTSFYKSGDEVNEGHKWISSGAKLIKVKTQDRSGAESIWSDSLVVNVIKYSEESNRVYFVLFTHIEDNTPAAEIGSEEARAQYTLVRNRLIEVAKLAKINGIKWSFQPDWKILLAILAYDDTVLTKNSDGKNVLQYIRDEYGAIIDPHSHEKQGYNYTDVAHLLDSLGVGGSTVIGGHVWDPSLPQFQDWDRFRVPVKGSKYPWAVWRGDILMGSGTPNHVNDPIISGVWQPLDKDNYFVHHPDGNIACVGQYKGTIGCAGELYDLWQGGAVGNECMMTVSYHLKPADITKQNGLKDIEDNVLAPLKELQDSGKIITTGFTELVAEWKGKYGAVACLLDSSYKTGVSPDFAIEKGIEICPNPSNGSFTVQLYFVKPLQIELKLFDCKGIETANLYQGDFPGGLLKVPYNGSLPAGVYFIRLQFGDTIKAGKIIIMK